MLRSDGDWSCKQIDSSTRFEEMDTDINTCFPVQIIVFVSLKVSSWTQLDLKSNSAKFLKRYILPKYLKPKESSLSKSIFRTLYTFLG